MHEHPTYEQRKFTCPDCDKVMILTREEYLTRNYTCPHCRSSSYSYYHPSPGGPCARCRRNVEHPIYYGGLPFGSVCINHVRGRFYRLIARSGHQGTHVPRKYHPRTKCGRSTKGTHWHRIADGLPSCRRCQERVGIHHHFL